MTEESTQASSDEFIEDPAAAERARDLLAGIEKLPTLPMVPMKILNLVDDPTSSIRDLQRFIMMDQSLTARILKISNSAYYGFPRQISTVSQAVVILGFSAVKSLALSASIVQVFKGGRERSFDLMEYWKYSIFAGAIANRVGEKVKYPLPEECLAAGILHGIGKLLMDQYLHEDFSRALSTARQKKISLIDGERQVMGMDHCGLGALLAERWKLPPQLVETIRFYPNPGLAVINPTLVALIHLGNRIAADKNFGDPGDAGAPRKLSEKAREILRLSPSDIVGVSKLADDELPKVKDLTAALLG